jgi:ABC-type lipoprotein export system ATPase subunit
MNSPEIPLIQMRAVVRNHGAPQPLRVAAFEAAAGDHVVIGGFDDAAAETFFHLVSGAALPDEGTVLVAGADTRDIATDTDWLKSLDRFGFVTYRSVLLETMSVAANLALPLTLDVDPLDPSMLREVRLVAEDVNIEARRLDDAAGTLDALGRTRLHLGRAVSTRPQLLLLEHPTRDLTTLAEREAFAQSLKRASERRSLGWIALSNDDQFARATGGHRRRLEPESGRITSVRSW